MLHRRGSPSVRRAWIEIFASPSSSVNWAVALRTEGVDRNTQQMTIVAGTGVGLRTEGVDRNAWSPLEQATRVMSPSVRRAWIEMDTMVFVTGKNGSPSVRRAWIEIGAN